MLEQTATSMTARILVQRGGIGTAFVTCNRLSPGKSIEMTLQEGPFSALRGLWLFEPLADNACKVSLDLQFEIANPLLRATVGRLFEQVTGTMVDAFCQRADSLDAPRNHRPAAGHLCPERALRRRTGKGKRPDA